MEERIKAIYNDCWGIYKKYLSNHNMALWNQNMEAMMRNMTTDQISAVY